MEYRYMAITTWAITGFIHFFRPKIQGLFKDFQGPNFEISRTSFIYVEEFTHGNRLTVQFLLIFHNVDV